MSVGQSQEGRRDRTADALDKLRVAWREFEGSLT